MPLWKWKKVKKLSWDILMKVMNAGLKTECKEILIELKKYMIERGTDG